MSDARVPLLRASRWATTLIGVFLIVVAVGGFILATTGHLLPSHPYAETTLGLIGTTLLLSTTAQRTPTLTVVNLITSGLALIGAALWILSAFTRLTSSPLS